MMKVIPLSEGTFSIDSTKVFIPFDDTKDKLSDRPTGSILVEIQPFCVVTDTDIIIIDTGLGYSNPDGTLQIHQNLLNEGINPMEVTKVLLSHLHKDHSGGIAREDKVLGKSFLSFPNAQYYVNKDELRFAFEKGRPSYIPDELVLLRASDKITLLDESGTVDDYIHYEVTGAHCPYHTAFTLRQGNQHIFFGGDVAPQLQQMKSRFIAKYDFDGKKCMELRQQWWAKGQEEGWMFLFYHDIKTPVYKAQEYKV
jgi:glyoxylase-like metal-dependent hydrolase (beta-lactamase superfamily II)